MNTDETQISDFFRGQKPRPVKNLPQIPSAPIYADSLRARFLPVGHTGRRVGSYEPEANIEPPTRLRPGRAPPWRALNIERRNAAATHSTPLRAGSFLPPQRGEEVGSGSEEKVTKRTKFLSNKPYNLRFLGFLLFMICRSEFLVSFGVFRGLNPLPDLD
jgi:hypothetical protein